MGDGHALALQGVVHENGHFKLVVGEGWDRAFIAGGVPNASRFDVGDYALFVRFGTSDFENFDPTVYDVMYRNVVEPQKTDTYLIPGHQPGTPVIAWIYNTVGWGTPYTSLWNCGRTVVA